MKTVQRYSDLRLSLSSRVFVSNPSFNAFKTLLTAN